MFIIQGISVSVYFIAKWLKKSLNNKIREEVLKINYLNYKDSMQSLIFKDVEKILMLINEREG